MAAKKTSAEEAREQAEEAALGSMLDGAFGAMEGIEPPPSSPGPSGPPGPPTGPPSGPPKGPPQGPPANPPVTEDDSIPEEEPVVEDVQETPVEPVQETPVEPVQEEAEPIQEEAELAQEGPANEQPEVVEEVSAAETESKSEEVVVEEVATESPPPAEEETPEPVASEPPQEDNPPAEAPIEEPVEDTPADDEREMEIARLTAEIERLRGSLVGAVEVIEEIEETPMPPVVLDNIVIPPHIVADFARMGRQLSREGLIKGTMGAISMLHPDEPGLMISTRHSTMLARLDERGIVGGPLGGDPPRGAIAEWKVHEVLLASVAALATGGPAACIHMQGPYTTAASSEKDLILVQPIDVLGKEHIGKVVIVDPDDDAQEEFLRQVAEALQQGGMRCVVVRGYGAFAVGANLDQAMANAAMLEHSMQVLLLARQANLKL